MKKVTFSLSMCVGKHEIMELYKTSQTMDHFETQPSAHMF